VIETSISTIANQSRLTDVFTKFAASIDDLTLSVIS